MTDKLPWPGNALIPNIPHEIYHSDPWGDAPCLSQSIANLMLECPLLGQAFHPRLGKLVKRETGAMARGTLLHSLLLGSGPSFIALDYPDWRTKDSQRDKAEAIANGQKPVLLREYDDAQRAASTILRSLRERHDLDMGEFETELTATWESEGVRCHGRFDMYSHGEIVDPKGHEGRPSKWAAGMRDRGNDIQAAAYIEAVETIHPELAGRVRFRYLVINPTPPYASCIVNVEGPMLALGQDRWHRAKLLWAQCLETRRWPTYADLTPTPPNWALEEELLRSIETVEEEYRGQQE